MTFREKLNRLRRAKGWSVKTLAENAGLPVSTVNSYLIEGHSQRLPTLANAVALAKALGVTVGAFHDCKFSKKSET